MNIWVRIVDDMTEQYYGGAEVTFDTTVLQVVHRETTTTFPLRNVLYFSTTEDES